MSRVFNCKKTTIMGVVFILLLMQIEAFAGEDWQRITQLPTGRLNFATAVVENKVYLIGGSLFKNPEGPYGISTVEVYDPQTNTWRRVADMPTPRTIARAAVVDGVIYVFGGFNSKDRFFQNWKLPVHVEAYNPQTDTWTRKRNMPVSRINFDLAAVGGRVYLIGGTTGFGEEHEQRMDRLDIYDPETNRWSKGPKMPTRRDPVSVAVVSTCLYVIGGFGWPPALAGVGPLLTSIEEYDPRTHRWQKRGDMLDLRYAFETVVVKDNIYLIGGRTDPEYLASVDVYNPQKESWRNISELPTPLSPYGAAAVKGHIYVFGGYNRERGHIPDVLVYDTGFHAVEADGKMPARWGELKAKHPEKP